MSKEIDNNGCTHNCPHEQHHHGSPGDRGDLQRDHRPRVPRDARQVRSQARARVGQLGRRRRAVVVALLAIITALGLALVPFVAQAASVLAPPQAGPVAGSRLPNCSDLITDNYGAATDALRAGTGLGYAAVGMSKPSLLIAPGSYNVQFAPAIPCLTANLRMVVPAFTNVISGDPPQSRALGHWTSTWTCTTSSGAQTVTQNEGNISLLSPLGTGSYPGMDSGLYATDCAAIVRVALTLCAGYPCDNSTPNVYATFVPSQWNSSDSGFTAATSAAQVLGSSVEVAIRCNIDNSGADIVAITQNVVASIVNWVPCMLIPVGWDRASKIPDAWSTGPVGQLTAAYKQAVPGGIACGAVGTIAFFSRTISLDTCQADFAPGYVKTVVGYVLILGVCLLIVRRIMWSVGSKA